MIEFDTHDLKAMPTRHEVKKKDSVSFGRYVKTLHRGIHILLWNATSKNSLIFLMLRIDSLLPAQDLIGKPFKKIWKNCCPTCFIRQLLPALVLMI